MKLNDFDRIVVMSVDSRYPDMPTQAVQALRRHGANDPQIFLNGRGTSRLDMGWYDMVHMEEPPATWTHPRGLWDYGHAYKEVIRRALEDGKETLLVCEDDIEFSTNFDAVTLRAQVPDDWQLLYYGAFHHWAPVAAAPVSGHQYVRRLTGGELGTQAVAWRREAMERFLEKPIDRPLDHIVAALHKVLPSYCLEPSVVRQMRGVRSAIDPSHEPFQSDFLYQIK